MSNDVAPQCIVLLFDSRAATRSVSLGLILHLTLIEISMKLYLFEIISFKSTENDGDHSVRLSI